jgi:site-specific DNA recombinase
MGPVATAAYLRVSTPKQSEALQRDAITRAAAARGETVELWFAEKMGGQRSDRPELEAVRDLARRGEISVLWVFRLDRLARGAVFLLNCVTELKQHGCRLEALDVPGDCLRGPWAPAILATLGTAAEIELEAIRERTAAARAKAEAAGKRWGRPLGPTEDRTAELEILLDGLKDGLTLRQAAETAGLSYGTAQRLVAAAKSAAKEAEAR